MLHLDLKPVSEGGIYGMGGRVEMKEIYSL
jgi:hypothetical protein